MYRQQRNSQNGTGNLYSFKIDVESLHLSLQLPRHVQRQIDYEKSFKQLKRKGSFIIQFSSLITHHSIFITHHSSLKTLHPVWHHHSLVITQYFSIICGTHPLTQCQLTFLSLFSFPLLLPFVFLFVFPCFSLHPC